MAYRGGDFARAVNPQRPLMQFVHGVGHAGAQVGRAIGAVGEAADNVGRWAERIERADRAVQRLTGKRASKHIMDAYDSYYPPPEPQHQRQTRKQRIASWGRGLRSTSTALVAVPGTKRTHYEGQRQWMRPKLYRAIGSTGKRSLKFPGGFTRKAYAVDPGAKAVYKRALLNITDYTVKPENNFNDQRGLMAKTKFKDNYSSELNVGDVVGGTVDGTIYTGLVQGVQWLSADLGLWGIRQGDDFNQRIGRQICIKKIDLMLRFQADSGGFSTEMRRPTNIRFVVMRDSSWQKEEFYTNIDQLPWKQQSPRKAWRELLEPEWGTRFEKLVDRTITAPSFTGAYYPSGANNPQRWHHLIPITIDFKDGLIIDYATDNGDLTDITQNNLWISTTADQIQYRGIGTVATYKWNYYARIHYTDV